MKLFDVGRSAFLNLQWSIL